MRRFKGGHEGTTTNLHVHDEAIKAFSELLAQDRSGDESDVFDRARCITKRIQDLVCRRNVLGLPHHEEPIRPHHRAQLVDPVGRAVANDTLEFVHGTTGMA